MLKPYDKVVIYNKGVNERLNQSISVGGYVKSPTALPLQEQMYVEDAILLAGGFEDMADQDLVYINREDRDPSTAAISTAFTISIDQDYLLGKTNQPKHGFTLMDKDIITVRKQLGVEAASVITIKGEVNYPRNFIAEFEQLNFQELITAAGGLKPTALLSASRIVRDGKVLAVDLTKLPKNQQIFENGDVVTFAKNRGEVFVTGAVEQENYFVWEANKKAKYYLKNSGGKLKEADRSYLTLPNGKSKKINFFNNPIVLPDSKIVVNRKVKKERVRNGDGLSKVLSVATILTSLVTSVVLVSQIQ
jgi:protein involved in polysaccharide export with SLBB domain